MSIDNVASQLIDHLYGVPQGSVMGRIEYCNYILYISYIILTGHFLPELLLAIVAIVSASLTSERLPESFKIDHVKMQ